ncbi:hypothetical protein U1701_13430 [Sphingomonas sp. PB2P19]|uniref:hypothetical protein n=1 Tax=Sphingomonas rhamnosi TaxID=3096156 RepID=UPI002FCA4478
MDVRTLYDRNGYALVPGLLAPEVANAFLHRLDEDMTAAGTPLGSRTQGSALLSREAIEVYGYHYPPMLGLLWGLTPFVADALGRDLLPSYSYFRIYREGDICRVHTDRPSCEHSLSLTLDYSDGVPWPLDIGTGHIAVPQPVVTEGFDADAFVATEMMPGDGILYQGVHRRHGRVTPNPNGWSAHLFLHWVERGGRYAEFAFDGNSRSTRPLDLVLAPSA